MSWAMIGGLVGGVLGLVNFAILQSVARKMELNPESEKNGRGAKVMRIAAWADLIIFPLVGYYVGPMIGS